MRGGLLECLAGGDRLGGDAVGAGPRATPLGVAVRAAAKKPKGVVPVNGVQVGDVEHVDAAGSHGPDALQSGEVLFEVQAARGRCRHDALAQQVDDAQGLLPRAFQFADDRAGVQVIAAHQAQPLGHDAHVDAVVLLAREDGVHGAVAVDDEPQLAGALEHVGGGGEAGREEIIHDVAAALRGDVLQPPQGLFRGVGGDVEEMPLGFARFGLRLLDRVDAVAEAVAPAVERLAIHVFIVLGGIQSAGQAFVDDRGIVLGAEAELGLDRAAQQGASPLVQPRPLVVDADVRAGKGLHQRDRNPHVFQPQAR